MKEIIKQTGEILAQSQELFKLPMIKEAVSSFLSWIGDKIFAGKRATQEKLRQLIEQQKADAQTIEELKNKLEYALEDNEELQKQLAEKVKELQVLLEKAGVQTNKTNTATIYGDNNINLQDNPNSNITIQKHSGTGDNVAGDKIIGKE